MKEFKVNNYIVLKLERGKTNIYIKNRLFKQCKSLVLNIPKYKLDTFDDLNSIDDVADRLNKSFNVRNFTIPPELEFWGHCSNLQVWVEMNYDTRLIHSNLAFPLLKKLVEIGDNMALRVFKEEIVKRFKSENFTVINYLLKENYINYLSEEELEHIFLENNESLRTFYELNSGLSKPWNHRYQLLIHLMELGDVLARKFLKEDIKKRIYNNNLNFIEILRSNSHLLLLFSEKELSDIFLENNELIKDLKNLERLDLGYRDLTIIPKFIEQFKHLKELNLSFNKIDSLANVIGSLKHLETLDLRNNNISSLPSSIFYLKSLQNLYLDNNSLKFIPNSIGKLKSLKKLDLRKNLLIILPDSIIKLRKLEGLNLSNNKLIELPKNIGQLIKLKELYIHRNQIKELPTSIGNLRSLKCLNIFYNRLNMIPSSTGRLDALETLNLE